MEDIVKAALADPDMVSKFEKAFELQKQLFEDDIKSATHDWDSNSFYHSGRMMGHAFKRLYSPWLPTEDEPFLQ